MATMQMRLATGGDHRFFLNLAIAMAAVVFSGFPLQLAMGRSTFAVPPIVHLHAVVFFGWTVLFVIQTALAGRSARGLHRRLMICGMATLTGPAFGRLLPLPVMIPWAAWGVFCAVMLFPLAGMIGDLRRGGHVHRAWWWGAGPMAVVQIAIVAASPPGLGLYHLVVRGGAGADVAPLAYPAPPPA